MRQKIRRSLLFISFLLFPITIWYFSPYLIIQAASEHIMNGSFIVFVSMFVLSIFLEGYGADICVRQAGFRSVHRVSMISLQNRENGT